MDGKAMSNTILLFTEKLGSGVQSVSYVDLS